MHFDRNRATLVATPADVENLAEYLAKSEQSDNGTAAVPAEWVAAGLTVVDTAADAKPRLDATVTGVVEVLTKPDRSVVIERFDGQIVVLMFVAWDRSGRATITEAGDTDHLIVTATALGLLPGLLSQALRLRPGGPSATRPPMKTTAEVIEQLLGQDPDSPTSNGNSQTSSEQPADSDLENVLGSVRHAWRATGSWTGQDADSSVIVLSAGGDGLWLVESDRTAEAAATAQTKVTLLPLSPDEAIKNLGDVVTGRTAQSQSEQST